MHTFSHSLSVWHPRQQYGNYELLKLLGQGGFANVYLGEHIYLHTRAAIKIVRSLDAFDVNTFFDEARLAARLRHPHIIRVLDFDLEDEVPFLVMDYAPNGSVRHRYPAGWQPPVAVILDYVEQIADALHYLHSRGLIHRDIKPENLLLDRNGQVLLSDFGIAIALQKAVAGEQTPLGTVYYMAQEQIEGYSCLESDQYSLGVVVYEWLSGVRPFQGSVGKIVQQHLSAPPPSMCELVPDLPPAVEEVVFRALAKDPQDRYEDVRDFATALRGAFENKPFVVRGTGFSARPTWQKKSERGREKTGGVGSRRRETWKEIATCSFIDLLAGTALWCVLALLGIAPLLIEAFLALFMTLLPIAGAFARKNIPLFFLICSLAVAAALAALFSHALIMFNVVYTILLILSLLVVFEVSFSEM